MRPLHIAALVAVALVGLFFWLQREDETRRAEPAGGPVLGRRGPDAGAPPSSDAPAPAATAAAVTVRVVDDAGNAADDARVEVRGPVTRVYTAGRDGLVAMDALPAGHYDLLARRGDACGGRPFACTGEGALDLGTLRISGGVRISGHVFGAGGRRLEGASIEAMVPIGPGPIRDAASMIRRIVEPDTVVASATSGPDGAYTLLVPRGTGLALRASALGHAPEHEPGRAWVAPVDGLDFVLGPAARITGTALDPADRPVAGARVLLLDVESLLLGSAPRSATITGTDGRFDLSCAETGSLLLVVRAVGYALHVQADVQPDAAVNVRLRPVTLARVRVVLKDSGRPVRGVEAMLNADNAFGSGTTDDDGHAELELMQIENPGAGNGEWQVAMTGGGIDPAMRAVTPTWDEARTVAELGTVEVEPGGTCRGRILDAVTGEPVAGASVRTLGGTDFAMMAWGGTGAESLADGTYELTGVPLGATLVHANHPDYVTEINPLQQLFMRSGEEESIFPPGSREVAIDVRLQPAARVAGRVVDQEGAPVAGARVEQEADANAMAIALVLGSEPRFAITDRDGRFTMGGLSPGKEVKLVARHRDYAAPAPLAVQPPRDGLRITLRPGTLVEGTVTNATGEPLAGVRVAFALEADTTSGPFPGAAAGSSTRPTLTDDRGRFVLRNIPAGDGEISLDHPDYRPRTEPLHVPAGQERLEPAPYRLDAGLSIEGLVVDAQGEPLADVRIVADFRGEGQFESRGAKTDAQGRFVLPGLREGDWRLDVRRAGMDTITGRPIVPAGAAGMVLTVREAASLTGVVTSARGPVAGAQVQARPLSAPEDDYESYAWAQTDAEGGFELTGLDPLLEYDLEIGHELFRTLRRKGVRPGAPREAFRLEPGMQVSGVVVDEDGEPVAEAWVTASAAQVAPVTAEYAASSKGSGTDAQGRFRIGGLAPGRIRLEAGIPGESWTPGQAVVVAAGSENVRIVIRSGIALSGRIVHADGTVPAQVVLEVLDEEGDSLTAQIVAHEQGRFVVRGLEPGSYRLRVTAFDGGEYDESTARTFGPFPTGGTGLVLTVDW